VYRILPFMSPAAYIAALLIEEAFADGHIGCALRLRSESS